MPVLFPAASSPLLTRIRILAELEFLEVHNKQWQTGYRRKASRLPAELENRMVRSLAQRFHQDKTEAERSL